MRANLFECFQRRLLWKLPFAALAGDEVDRFPNRQRGAKVEVDPTMTAGRAGNLLQAKRHVRLCPEIKLHIGMDRERVETFLADASPVTVGSHESFVNGKAGLFADGTLDRVQATFYFLLSDGDH